MGIILRFIFQAANINGPSGLEMNDNGDGTTEITINLQPGDYTYKFRNGFYDYWDSPGWENDNSLNDGGCAHGTYFDRASQCAK